MKFRFQIVHLFLLSKFICQVVSIACIFNFHQSLFYAYAFSPRLCHFPWISLDSGLRQPLFLLTARSAKGTWVMLSMKIDHLLQMQCLQAVQKKRLFWLFKLNTEKNRYCRYNAKQVTRPAFSPFFFGLLVCLYLSLKS